MLDIKLRQLNYSSMFDNSYSCKSFANMLEHLLHPYIHILQLIDCFKLALLYIFSKFFTDSHVFLNASILDMCYIYSRCAKNHIYDKTSQKTTS